MKSWLRALTYVLAALSGVGAVVFPAAASILVPVATGLAGWALLIAVSCSTDTSGNSDALIHRMQILGR